MGFSSEGKIKALDLKLYNNAGNSLDLSHSIMDRALLHTDNSYAIPVVRSIGCCAFTHQASNTAYRGFGGPQVRLLRILGLQRSAHCGCNALGVPLPGLTVELKMR